MLNKAAEKIALELAARRRQKRIKKAVTWAGLIVILFSFIVREMLQEPLKDATDQITAAQTAMDNADEHLAILANQTNNEMRLRQITAALASPERAGQLSKGDLIEEANEVRVADAEAGLYLAELQKFNDSLPVKLPILQQRHDKLANELQKIKSDADVALTKNLAVPNPYWPQHVLVLTQLLQVCVFDFELEALRESTVKAATTIKGSEKHLYEQLTSVYLGLGLLGIFITGYGTITGQKVPLDE